MNGSCPPKRRKRWYQFSLREILLFSVAVAGLLGVFQLGFELGIVWGFFFLFIGAQWIFVMGSERLPRGQSPGWLVTALWILLTWAILTPWFCWVSEMSTWREMPRRLWPQLAYWCLYKLNYWSALVTPFVFAAIAGFSRRSLRFAVVLIAVQVLVAIVVIAVGAWIARMFAWSSGYY